MIHNSFITRAMFIAATVLISALVPASTSLAQEQERVDKVSAKGFEATVEATETTLKKNGFMIMATIDHQNMLIMVGTKIKGSKTIEFGKPEMGKMLMPMAPEAGLEMPGRFYIWERNDGKTAVSYYKPSVGFSNYGSEMITKMGEDMDGMWEMIVDEATK